jgi:hypothetical protein
MTDNTRFPPGAWFRLPKALVDDGALAELGGSAAKVYLVLERHADDDGLSYPSRATIAREAGLSVHTVGRAIGELVKLRLVARTKRTLPTGEPTTNLYQTLPLAPQLGSRTRATTPPGRVGALVRLGSCISAEGVVPPVPHKESPSKRTPVKEPQEKESAKADAPAGLLALIDAWNALGPAIVRTGNGAQRDPPAKATLEGWRRAMKDPDLRAALQDIPALLGAIRENTFCHGQGWFTLPWLFGKNQNNEFKLTRLLAGAYTEDRKNGRSNTKPGPGQRHDPARPCEAI